LRSAFAANPGILDCGEIFHNDPTVVETRFLNFLQQWPQPVRALLEYREGEAIGRAFLKQLRSEARGRSILIDVKHNSWGVLGTLWKFPHDVPLFMNLLKQEGTSFLFLKRRELADQVISFHIASRTNAWHETLPSDPNALRLAPHALDPDFARRMCALFVQAEQFVERCLNSYSKQLHLDYEDVFQNEAISVGAAAQLERFTGLRVGTGLLPTHRNRLEKRNVITNYDASNLPDFTLARAVR
jgi:hypothetical protein